MWPTSNKIASWFISVCANRCVRTKTELPFHRGKLGAVVKESLLFFQVSLLIDASGFHINILCAPFLCVFVCNLRHKVIHFSVLCKSIQERNACGSASEQYYVIFRLGSVTSADFMHKCVSYKASILKSLGVMLDFLSEKQACLKSKLKKKKRSWVLSLLHHVKIESSLNLYPGGVSLMAHEPSVFSGIQQDFLFCFFQSSSYTRVALPTLNGGS